MSLSRSASPSAVRREALSVHIRHAALVLVDDHGERRRDRPREPLPGPPPVEHVPKGQTHNATHLAIVDDEYEDFSGTNPGPPAVRR
jgi:hypothetical protein